MGFDQSNRHPIAGFAGSLGCDGFRERHAEYVDGVMDPDTADRWRRHATECLPCARYDRSIRRSCALVESLPPVRAGEDFTVRLRARLARDRRRRGRFIATGQLVVPGAAVIALVAAVAWSPLLRTAEGAAEPVELAPVQARLPGPSPMAPQLGGGAYLTGPRLYRADTTVPGVWLGDVGLPHSHMRTVLQQVSGRDPGYPTVFLDPPEFRARPGLLVDRAAAPDLRR
ncbi:MAG: hypothetical protein ABFS34_10740 [Gemmatimonadota bacterium]